MNTERVDGSFKVDPTTFRFVKKGTPKPKEVPVLTSVGSETLAWVENPVDLATKRIMTVPVCAIANAVETNEVLNSLYQEMTDEQQAMARAVFEFESINFMTMNFRPDQGLVTRTANTPEIFRVNHAMGEDSIAVFFTRARGPMEDSRFFLMGASRADRTDMVLAELAQYGYADKGKSSSREVVLLAA